MGTSDEHTKFYRVLLFDTLDHYMALIQRLANASGAAALNNRALAYSEIGEVAAALTDFAAAIDVDAAVPIPYVNRGDLQRRLGNLAAAVIDYGAAIARAPDDPYFRRSRAHALHALGRYDEAIIDYDEAIRAQPEFTRTHDDRARAASQLPPVD